MYDYNLPPEYKHLCTAVADLPDVVGKAAADEFLKTIGEQAALHLAQSNEVVSIVAHRLMGTDSGESWRQIHEVSRARLAAYLSELDSIAVTLAKHDILLVALKNGGIARGIYPCPGCCPMGDLDVLVEKKDFRAAHAILLDQGYRFEYRSPLEETDLKAAEESGGAEYWKMLPNGEKMWLELQWRPVAGRWIRPDQEPSAEELMARSMPIPDTAVRLLAPEDNLLQVALHTAKHSYVRAPGFRLHTDVDRIVRRQVIDWQIFVGRVRRLRVKTAVYFSLAIPVALFDTPVPNEVLEQLKPRAWKERLISRWIQRAGIFNPQQKKFSRLGYIVFTTLLYDDLGGLWRGVFPDRQWMQQRYGFRRDWLLPYYHGRRLIDLVFRRVTT